MKTDIDSAVRFHGQFKKLYEAEFINFANDYVQVTDAKLAQLQIETGCLFEIRNRVSDKSYPYEVFFMHKGVKFLAVGTGKEFADVGIKVK